MPKIHTAEKTSFSTSGFLKTKFQHVKLDPYLLLRTKLTSTYIKHLSIRPDTFKLLKDQVESTSQLTVIDKDFLSKIPVA